MGADYKKQVSVPETIVAKTVKNKYRVKRRNETNYFTKLRGLALGVPFPFMGN
jgi:hypothetical protein